MSKLVEQYDIVIIGAGVAGLSFACSVIEFGIKVLVVEKAGIDVISKPKEDGREIALTHLSVKILKKIGVWDYINDAEVSLLKEAKVFNGDADAVLNFKENNIDALGYLVSNYKIRKALFERVKQATNITLVNNTIVEDVIYCGQYSKVVLAGGRNIVAKLVVAADSRFSTIRRKMGIPAVMKDFSKTMIVTRMEHELAHDNIALEYFYYGKTLALLPMAGNNSSVIITLATDKVKAMFELEKSEFDIKITQFFKARLGLMKQSGKRYCYPLVAVHAQTFIAGRFALIGDAAVSMHPVTAHGFNLGLRGQDILATLIKEALSYKQDIGSELLLKKFENKSIYFTRLMFFSTNRIVDLFTNDALHIKKVRKFVLGFSERFPPIKYLITRHLTEAKRCKFLPF